MFTALRHEKLFIYLCLAHICCLFAPLHSSAVILHQVMLIVMLLSYATLSYWLGLMHEYLHIGLSIYFSLILRYSLVCSKAAICSHMKLINEFCFSRISVRRGKNWITVVGLVCVHKNGFKHKTWSDFIQSYILKMYYILNVHRWTVAPETAIMISVAAVLYRNAIAYSVVQ